MVLLIALIGLLYWGNQEDKKKSAELQERSAQNVQLLKEQAAQLEQQKNQDSFYQKLADGFDVNVLIVGDSIGAQQWPTLLKNRLEETYSVNVTVTNVSMGGNSSYAGYVRTMTLEDGIDYDLAILCYGQNDSINDFSLYYEAMIRALQTKYSDCSILSILESSQRDYTEKIKSIQTLCDYYDIPVADTIAAFQASSLSYDELAPDGVHPGEFGQEIYCQTVGDIIDENVSAATGKMEKTLPFNQDVTEFDHFVWYGVETGGFERIDEVTYTLQTTASGRMGIDYTYQSGENKADIYIDDLLYQSPTVTFNYDFSQRHILVVSNDCTVQQEIRVVFNSKEQADGFRGVCFSWD